MNPAAARLKHSRGVALIMVVAVLAGLLALAAPFVLSMIQHNRSARTDLNTMLAQEGANAAVAHAMAQLHKTLRYDPEDKRPEVTTLEQLKIDMGFTSAPEKFHKLELQFQNPQGLLWSARVEDEQGKVNLNSAPPTLLGNLLASGVLTDRLDKDSTLLIVDDAQMFYTDNNPSSVDGTVCVGTEPAPLRYTQVRGNTITLKDATTLAHGQGSLVYDGRAKMIVNSRAQSNPPVLRPFGSVHEIKAAVGRGAREAITPTDFARVERCLTTCSGMATPAWGNAELASISSNGAQLRVENGEGFAPGALIRIRRGGQTVAFARARFVLRSGTGATIVLEENLSVSGNETYAQSELRHPINLNTAPREVLEACFTGLCLLGSKEAVSRQQASQLAPWLVSGEPLATHEELRKKLEGARDKGIINAQQCDAVYINATEYNSPKLRCSTVPFCYHSFGSYTIEGAGVVNADNGVQLARHVVRQLVTLPSPGPGRFKVEYQVAFEDLLQRGMGDRVVTFPVAMAKYNQRGSRTPLQYAAKDRGDVRLDVGQCGEQPGGWVEHCDNVNEPGFRQDGYDLRQRGKGFNPPATANTRATPLGQPGAVELWVRPLTETQMVFFDQGADEERNRVLFLYEPGRGLVLHLYDGGLEYSGTTPPGMAKHLIRNPVECVFDMALPRNDWYHVAASWKSSFMNGQEIRVDAQPFPGGDLTKVKFKPGTRLARALALAEKDTLEVEEADDKDFPKAGALKIGEEIIEYGAREGSTFSNLRRGSRMSAGAEHQQGEFVVPFGYANKLADDLPCGKGLLSEELAKASKTRTTVRLRPNNYVLDSETAKLPVEDTLEFPPSGYIVVGGELIYYGRKTVMEFEQLKRAQSGRRASAPARNFGGGTSVVLASFQVTTHADYDDEGYVQLTPDSAAPTPKPVEWCQYTDKKTEDGKHYLLSVLNTVPGLYWTGTPANGQPGATSQRGPNVYTALRGAFGMRPETTHDRGEKVIPVVQMEGPHCGDGASPYGGAGVSTVSVVQEGIDGGDLRYVRQAYLSQRPHWVWNNATRRHDWRGWIYEYYVGLNDFASKRFPARVSRLLKWPSGELPNVTNARRFVCSDRNGGAIPQGHVDELKTFTSSTNAGRIAMTLTGEGIKEDTAEILVEGCEAWPRHVEKTPSTATGWPAAGLIRIEDELVFYTSLATQDVDYYVDVMQYIEPLDKRTPNLCKSNRYIRNPDTGQPLDPKTEPNNIFSRSGVLRLSKCIRGALGTNPAPHPAGAQIMLFDAMRVGALKERLRTNADRLSIEGATAGFPKEGYLWLGDSQRDGEVLSYLNSGGGAFSDIRHFRGSFGTQTRDHEKDTIVRELPFRYWDRQGLFYDGPGLAYIQAGHFAEDSMWNMLEIVTTGTEEMPQPGRLTPRLLMRFDGMPNWDGEITNQPGGLYEFRPRSSLIPIHGESRRGVKANQIEIRVYWEFQPGAFLNGDWKRNFGVQKLRAMYYSPLQMRRLDEIERR